MHTRHPLIVIASVVALALAAGLVLAAPARATFPGRNGLITFAADVAGDSQIFVMNPDGSGLKQISHGAADSFSFDPSISPDGQTIVFGYWGSEPGEIRAMTTTGANPRHLASGTLHCSCPSFSPDGGQVVFVTDDTSRVWVMNADGSHQRHLTADLGSDTLVLSPTYSPDGKTIVFAVRDGGVGLSAKVRDQILAMNADGTHLRRLAYMAPLSTNNAVGVSFSPDGRKIVYGAFLPREPENQRYIIRIMNADGSDQRLLPRSYGFRSPCYSPNGRQILCVNGHHQISVVNAKARTGGN